MQQGRSLYKEKVMAIVATLEKNEKFLSAILIYLAALSVLLAFPIFPLIAVPFAALIPAAVGYYNPVLGTLVGVLFGLVAVAYQTPVLGWIFTIAFSISLVTAFNYWFILAILQIIIFAPFAKGLGMLGGIIIPVMFLSALRLGAKRSLLVTLPAVYIVLLLTAMWNVDNGAFMVVNHSAYEGLRSTIPQEILMPMKGTADITGMAGAVGQAFVGMFGPDVFTYLNPLLSLTMGTTIILFFGDIGLIEIAAIGAIMYFASLVPGILRGSYRQTAATVVFWLFIPLHYFLAALTQSPFHWEIIIYVALTTALVYYLDIKKFSIAGQTGAVLREKEQKFSKFGVQDLGLASTTKLSDIGNYESVKKELREAILLPLQRKDISVAYKIRPPKGILLFGPPGTGKTMLMRALAKELEVGFYYVKASQLLSQYFGESEKNVSEIFSIARKNAPAVLFFDEIDAIGKSREYARGDEAAARVLSTMLEEMDGLTSDNNVLVVGATNVPHMLDKALIRPGRLDKIIYMPLPDREGRERIFEVQLKGIPLANDVDIKALAKKTERFSGADIANLCKEAVRLAAKRAAEKEKLEPVLMDDFNKVLRSLKPSTSLSMLDDYERFKLDYERRVDEEEKEKEKKVTWEDVIGLDDVREMLKEAVEIPLLHEELLEKYDVKPSKGVLMFGPPGCGKTLIVKAAANEMNVNVFTLSGADLLKKGYEGAVAIIKETFNRARENPPAIIFIDEIESIAPSRDLYSSKYVEDVVTQLLQEMDGMRELKNVVLIGATNKPEMIDKALLRPGRLDKIVFIPPPIREQREAMFRKFLAKVPKEDINYAALAAASEGFTGADISGVCQEAKLGLVREGVAGKKEAKLRTEDVLKIIGRRRPSLTLEMLQEYKQFLDEYGERV
ncbi:MAG: AAA family ATPase [Candidatus Micrarchaeota archaeon]|nr:AAA family ATPase [Candidatus Micrarchaeota archaeon]